MRHIYTNSSQPSMEIGENKMNIVDNITTQFSMSLDPIVPNHPVILWLEQNFRKIQGKPLLQEEVLDKVLKQLQEDENLLGVLLFGSVASGTHTWKSDIDFIFVYESYEPTSGLVNQFVDGIVVQYFFTTFDTLVQNHEAVPYLLHVFCDGKILFDRYNSIAPVVDQLKGYFATHPEVEAEWVRLKELHQAEKDGPECAQTTIIERWDELEDKYSGGVRKRTFFRM
jgi:predicted nucleotidyltransferase